MTDWSELIRRYLTERRARLLSDSMCKNEQSAQTKFQAYCQKHQVVLLTQVRVKHLQSFHAELGKNLKPATRYAVLGSVRRFLKWATYRGHLMEDPGLGWPPRCPPLATFRAVPTEAQMVTLLAAPDSTLQGRRDQVFLEFLYGTGLRIRECAHVDLADLDLRESLVTVRVTKGGEQRVLPIGPRLKALLAEYLSEIRPQLAKKSAQGLFVDDRGQSMRTHTMAARLRSYSHQALNTPFSVHSVRHAYATHLLLGGAPIWAVAKLLGHKSLDSTALYTRMLTMDVEQELLRTHPRAKRKLTKKPSPPKPDPDNLEG